MGRILPSSDETATDRVTDPQLVTLDDDRADEVLSAVRSDTARSMIRALLDDPMAPAELASSVDTSVENATYHLDNLESARLVEVVDTAYSEKGREMSVYGPSAEPPLLFFGSVENEPGLRSAFADFVPVLGPIAVVIAFREAVARFVDLGDVLGEVP